MHSRSQRISGTGTGMIFVMIPFSALSTPHVGRCESPTWQPIPDSCIGFKAVTIGISASCHLVGHDQKVRGHRAAWLKVEG